MSGSSFQPPINLDPNQDPSQQTAFINQNFQQLANSLNPYIVSDGTTNRIILGKQPDGTYGLRVSQSGVDVGTATNSQLIFNSNQDVFKIVSKGTTTIPGFSFTPGNSGYSSVTVTHGLSFTPLAEVYVQGKLLNSSLALVASSYVPLPITASADSIMSYYFTGNAGNNYPLTILFAIDSTNLYIEAMYSNPGVGVNGSVNSIPVSYFFLQETAT